MDFIKRLNFLAKSQIFVSVTAMLLGIFILNEQNNFQFPLVLILFLTFWNGYLFTVFANKKDVIFWCLVGFVLISLLIFNFFNFQFYFKWLIILYLGLMYNAGFLNINLRKISIIKTFYVGFVWAMTLVWLPSQNENFCDILSLEFIRCFIKLSLHEFHWEWFSIVFLFVSAITFPFEIRDMERDNFITLPKKIGIQNTKYLSYLFLFLSLILATTFLKFEYSIPYFITIIFSFILIYFTNEHRKNWYYALLIESLSALPFVFSKVAILLFQ